MAANSHDSSYGHPGTSHVPVAVDPEHDIDSRSAAIWVIGGAIAVFLSLWVMVPIFTRVLEAERKGKIDEMANTEVNTLKEQQQAFLNGQNPTGRRIDDVLQSMAGK